MSLSVHSRLRNFTMPPELGEMSVGGTFQLDPNSGLIHIADYINGLWCEQRTLNTGIGDLVPTTLSVEAFCPRCVEVLDQSELSFAAHLEAWKNEQLEPGVLVVSTEIDSRQCVLDYRLRPGLWMVITEDGPDVALGESYMLIEPGPMNAKMGAIMHRYAQVATKVLSQHLVLPEVTA